MTVKSKPRFIVFPLILFTYVGLGQIPFSVFIDSVGGIHSRTPNGEIYWPTAIAGLVIIVILVYFTYKFILKFVLISIDTTNKSVTSLFPLQFKKMQYQFGEIQGFYLSHYYTRAAYIKVIVFKTIHGDTIKFSDFETHNFRKIEQVALEHFQFISETEPERVLLGEEKATYLATINREFDLKQAEDLRFFYYVMLATITFVLLLDHNLLWTIERKEPLIMRIIFYFLFFYSIIRLVQVNRTLKNLQRL